MIKVFTSFCFFLLFLSAAGTAQVHTCSGTVVDESKAPIEFANVFLISISSDSIIDAGITNEKGAFTFQDDGGFSDCKLSVEFIGFKKWETELKGNLNFEEIVLVQSAGELDEAVITGEKSMITREGDKLIFNVQSTPLKSGYDGMELLAVTPSVWVDGKGAIQMRNESATVLVNGRPLKIYGEDLANYISNLNSEDVQRIEIQSNQSSNTSATSTGGIINIVLKEKALGLRSTIKSYYTPRGNGLDLRYSGFNVNYGTEKWNLYGLYNYRRNHNLQQIDNEVNYRESNQLNTTSLATETLYKKHNYQLGFINELHKNHEIGFEVFGFFSDFKNDDLGKVNYFLADALTDSGDNNTDGKYDNNRVNGTLNYKWVISKKDKLSVFVDYSKNLRNGPSTVTTTYDNGTFENSKTRYLSDSETTIQSFQLDYEKQLKNDLNIDFGIQASRTDRLNSLITEELFEDNSIDSSTPQNDFNYKEDISSSYISLDKKIGEKNFFKTGLRIENTAVDKIDFLTDSLVNQDYLNWFPSFFYSRELPGNKSISASISQSLRRPSFRDLGNYITKVNDFQFFIGNPDLSPEFVDKLDINYDFKKSRVSVFYSKTKDAINGLYFLENDIAYYRKFNTGAQVQFGSEFNTSKQIKEWWFLRFSGYVLNRRFVNDESTTSFKQNTFNIKVFNTFSFNKTTSIDISAAYTSLKADAFFIATEVYGADVVFKKSFFDKRLNCRIYLDDIFNTLRYKNIREFDTFYTKADTKPISRTITFWVTYNISNKNAVSGKKTKSKNEASRRL
tara:strand:- start:75 stop:2444 length:2370 start_codon:yes stop_codon:yes gene_type:complete